MIRPVVAAQIVGFETAKQWVQGMEAAGLAFHFEDDPAEIINQSGRVFTDEEVPVVRDRVAALYSFDWTEFGCPIGYLLSLDRRCEAVEASFDTTMTRALTEAEAQSVAAAREAYERGDIAQTETAPGSGVWKLGQRDAQ